jgi:hypothetical protein
MTPPADESTALRRGIRTDLVIAVCALLVSALATGASWWQSRVVAQQLSSQVWPYLTFSSTYDPQHVALDLQNDGLGPAIVRSAVLSVDGKPYANPLRAFSRVFKRPAHRRFAAGISGLTPGSVIRASGNVQLFHVEGAWAARQFAAASAAGRVDFRVCYCSLLGNCWTVSVKQQAGDPQPVRSCPSAGADQYRVGAGIGL